MTTAELQALKDQRKALEAQIAEAQKDIPTVKLPKNKRVQIGEKGTLNFYGLRRFPVCLYLSEVQNLAAIINNPEFMEFVKENMAKIAVKTKEEV